jgi:succinyl-CoA synthetase beta subunit
MDLCEADGKSLLARHGIAVPAGALLGAGPFDPAALKASYPDGAVVKAQILGGGRGKQGLVKLAAPEGLFDTIGDIAGRLAAMGVEPTLLIEEKLAIADEYYLAFSIDDVGQCPRMLFSADGGVEVEAADTVAAFPVDPLRGLMPQDVVAFLRDNRVKPAHVGPVARMAASLFRVFVAEDAELLEVNPLVVTRQGRCVAADAKIVLDDAGGFRHRRDLELSAKMGLGRMTPLEREAEATGFTFVEMEGEVALMSAGAGLGMSLIDLLGDHGLRAACFVDGSAATTADNTAARLAHVFKRAQAADVRAILFYQNLGSRDLKPRVEALLDLLAQTPPPKPLYFGLLATYLAERNMTAAEGCAALTGAGFYATQDLRQLIGRISQDLGAPARPRPQVR